MASRRFQVVLLPGSVLPVQPAYAALLEVLSERVEAVAKDLEVYAEDEPPPDFGLGNRRYCRIHSSPAARVPPLAAGGSATAKNAKTLAPSG